MDAVFSTLFGNRVIIVIAIIIGLIPIFSLTELEGSTTISRPTDNDSLSYEIQERDNNMSGTDGNNTTRGVISGNNNTTTSLLADPATAVYETEAFVVPSNIKTFVIYMANEFHENWPEESYKHITNKNAFVLPTNLTISHGTSIAFHMADAPWDIPHDYIVKMMNANTHKTALQTPLLSYPKFNRGPSNSGTTVLPIGEYSVEAYLQGTVKVETQPITIKVINASVNHSSNITAGFFYSPQRPVTNPYDNDGQMHRGNLDYYRQQFPIHGLKIESVYNFHFASCSFYDKGKRSECTDEGGRLGDLYWHDNKTADHALIFWSSTRPYDQISAALDEMTWENVYT